MKLLCGVPDVSYPEFHHEVTNLLVVDEGLVTCDFKGLLEMSSPDEGQVFDKGRELMANTVSSRDLLTALWPLKAAYVWALSTRARYVGDLDFVCQRIHLFRCREMKSGRIFPSHEARGHAADWFSQIQPRTFYYADEGKGNELAHPLFDCWFCNMDGDAVLCAIVAGEQPTNPEKRAAELDEWIKSEQAKLKGSQTIYGVVLAPHVEGRSEPFCVDVEGSSRVGIVRGLDAVQLLGGLAQVLRWM